MKDKCADCHKKVQLEDLVQVINPTGKTKYKMVCEECFKNKHYEYVGYFKRL